MVKAFIDERVTFCKFKSQPQNMKKDDKDSKLLQSPRQICDWGQNAFLKIMF
jgi:hypothetical protein